MENDGNKERDLEELARSSSGLHFLSGADLSVEDFLKPLGEWNRSVSEPAEERRTLLAGLEATIDKLGTSITDFARSYKSFGLQPRTSGRWTFREWMPYAKAVFLIGDFNGWDKTATPLSKSEGDVWSCEIAPPLSTAITDGSKYKLYVDPLEGDSYYVSSAWCKRVTYTESLNILDPVVCQLEDVKPAPVQLPAREEGDRIYECHLSCVARPHHQPSFKEATEFLLPRIACNGYNAVLLVGVLECKEIADMGAQPISLFATARDLGLPQDLRAFVQRAHELDVRVLLSIAHDGAACCEDGLGGQLFSSGSRSRHMRSGARLYDYGHTEVLRYLLSSLAYYMDEFGVDGFRFQNVTSMIYKDQGFWLPNTPEGVDELLQSGDKTNHEALEYLMLANKLLHEAYKGSTSIADESSLFPDLCRPVAKGGLGFDMRQSSKVAECFRSQLHRVDEDWDMKLISSALLGVGRPGEKTIGYMESCEECTVGRRPLKIAMLSWETLHTIAAGGVAPHVSELAAALRQIGHEVHIFTRGTQANTWEHSVWGVVYHEVAFGVDSDFVREIENMCNAFVGRLLHVEGHVGGFDLIHGHDWLVGPAVANLKSLGKRCVFTMHSTEFGRCGNNAYGGQSARIREIEGHACHVADRVIAVSGVLKQEVCEQYSVQGDKIVVIYNGIHADPIANMEWHDEWSGNTKRDKGFSDMDPMFLFVGRLAVQKGPDLLVEAIPDILGTRGDAKFVIVGDGHMKAQLQGRVHQMGIGHAVHFTGSVKSGTAHLKSLLKSCDAVVVPSRNEPFGIVVLEAWAAGKPVIATTSGGPRDFVLHDRDGFLVDPNPGSIAWGCKKLCENFEHAKWMGKRAKDKALNEFNWSEIARQTERVYSEQLCVHGAPIWRSRTSGCPLATQLLSPHQDDMGVLVDSPFVMRGLSLLKMIRLISTSLGNSALLTWMGSEFGHLEPIDMPRPGNQFSIGKARISYGSADDKALRYKHLQMFDMFVNLMAMALQWFMHPTSRILVEDNDRKLIAFERASCLFVFNFHPTESCQDYSISSSDRPFPSDLICVLDTSEERFGGYADSQTRMTASSGTVKVSLAPRTAVVLAPAAAASALKKVGNLQITKVDDYLDTMC